MLAVSLTSQTTFDFPYNCFNRDGSSTEGAVLLKTVSIVDLKELFARRELAGVESNDQIVQSGGKDSNAS